MKRLEPKHEYDIMLPETNNRNIESFKSILPNFFYTSKTNSRILSTLDTIPLRSEVHEINSFFNLNAQLRSWYKIELTPENDEAYKTFLAILKVVRNRIPLELNTPLLNYENFKNGKLTIGNQQQKLFKYLLKKGLLTSYQVEQITHKKMPDNLYLCISRNPIDFLMCSTHQCFTSCLNLESDYGGAYYIALPSMLLDFNRAIAFITNGKLASYEIKGETIKHFRYITRSWVFMTEHDTCYCQKQYPSDGLKISNCLSSIYLMQYEPCKSKFHFSRGVLENSERAMIYLDPGTYLNTDVNGVYYTLATDSGSSGYMDFNYSGGFEDLENFDQLYDGENYCTCEQCGERVHNDAAFYDDCYSYCETCYYEIYTSCDRCYETTDRENTTYIEDADRWVCEYCRDTHYYYCDTCGRWYAEGTFCETCDQFYCPDCYADTHTQCDDCGEYYCNDDNHECESEAENEAA